jgi:molybdopterin molybdotransferase
VVEFFKLKTTKEVLAILDSFPPVQTEWVDLTEATGRVLAGDIVAPEDIPAFPRSSMDGYAVRARDTFGASESLPALFSVVGEVAMGEIPSSPIGYGQAVRISTGGMLPPGADAVVMVEYSQALDERTVEITRAVSVLENVIQPGDDVRKGSTLLRAGNVLRPQDVGLLAGLGVGKAHVHRRVRAAVISTGDELVPVEGTPLPGQVRDINSYTLGGLVKTLGAVPLYLGIVPDRFDLLRAKVEEGLNQADILLLSGGSSVGARDFTVRVFETFPDLEMLVHGVSIQPGKPTIVARWGNKALCGLPGHVASAMVIFLVFVRPLILKMSGRKGEGGVHSTVKAILERNLESAGGREDYVRVKLVRTSNGLLARPVFGKSGLISTMVEADGLICIDREAEGLYQGEEVEVMLFDGFSGGVW